MADSTYIIRKYIPDDFNSYVQLIIEAEKQDLTGRCTSPTVLGEHLDRPYHCPEQNLLIAESDGKAIGYIDVTPEPGIGRVILDCLVQPRYRRKGLATELSYNAIHRAAELGVRVVHVNVSQGNIAAKNLLSKLGFELVRIYHELRLQLSKVYLPDVDQFASTCRHLQHGEEAKLTQIQNRSFTGSWGFNPNTTEEISYCINSSNCSPQDVIQAIEADKTIGYCWTRINLHENMCKGLIHMIGVDPDYRGRGLGRLLLLAGLSYLKSREVEIAQLTVDSQNTAACALYDSVGFEISSITLWYEKVLD